MTAPPHLGIGKVRDRWTLHEACLWGEWVIDEQIEHRVKGHKALEANLEPLWS